MEDKQISYDWGSGLSHYLDIHFRFRVDSNEDLQAMIKNIKGVEDIKAVKTYTLTICKGKLFSQEEVENGIKALFT